MIAADPADRERRATALVVGLAYLVVLVTTVIAVVGLAPPVRAQTTDGETTVRSGQATLTVSQATDLDPAGAELDVRGAGFDERKGIYVAFCVVNGPGVAPGPCGGGIDTEGTSGSSVWISSDPPPYGEGLAVPYGPGGTFAVRLRVTGTFGDSVDCAVATCAVVTRNDHTRSSDRGQDLAVSLSFRPVEAVATVPIWALAIPMGGLAVLFAVAARRRRARADERDDTPVEAPAGSAAPPTGPVDG